MTTLAIAFGVFTANYLLGAAVLAGLDRDGRLLAWYRSAPGGPFTHAWLCMVVLQCWPGLVCARWWCGR